MQLAVPDGRCIWWMASRVSNVGTFSNWIWRQRILAHNCCASSNAWIMRDWHTALDGALPLTSFALTRIRLQHYKYQQWQRIFSYCLGTQRSAELSIPFATLCKVHQHFLFNWLIQCQKSTRIVEQLLLLILLKTVNKTNKRLKMTAVLSLTEETKRWQQSHVFWNSFQYLQTKRCVLAPSLLLLQRNTFSIIVWDQHNWNARKASWDMWPDQQSYLSIRRHNQYISLQNLSRQAARQPFTGT